MVSDNAVEARTAANAKPSFEDQDDVSGTTGIQVNREVAENTDVDSAIGTPVNAKDDDGDVLIYAIVADTAGSNTTDDENFSIDRATGQLKVKVKLNFESDAGAADNCIEQNACTVTVTATDPSGAKATQAVTITVTDANEAPKFTTDSDGATDGTQPPPTALTVEEEPGVDTPDRQLLQPDGGDSGTDPDNLVTDAYDTNDEDSTETAEPTYTLEGADKDKFNISASGNLTVCTEGLCGTGKAHDPNYEKQDSYSITVVATSGDR